jgi:hypothetical protein
VYFATQPTNLRQSFEGLTNQIRHALGYDPLLCVGVRYVAVGPAAGRRDGFGCRGADGRAT